MGPRPFRLPLDRFTDLHRPVVEPGGARSLHALRTAYSGARGVDSVDDHDEGEQERVRDILTELADEFDEDLD